MYFSISQDRRVFPTPAIPTTETSWALCCSDDAW
jgi:hypothetical protein